MCGKRNGKGKMEKNGERTKRGEGRGRRRGGRSGDREGRVLREGWVEHV